MLRWWWGGGGGGGGGDGGNSDGGNSDGDGDGDGSGGGGQEAIFAFPTPLCAVLCPVGMGTRAVERFARSLLQV